LRASRASASIRRSLFAFSRRWSVCCVEFRRFATLRSIVCHPAYPELLKRCDPVRREKFSLSRLFYPTFFHISYLWRRRLGPQFRDFSIGSRCERERWTYKKNTVLELTNRGKFRQLPDSVNVPVSEYCSIRLLPVFLSALYTLVWAGV